MGREISVIVSESELNAWKSLFNDANNWGIKSRFAEKDGNSRTVLNNVLNAGRGYPSSIAKIRTFYNAEQKKRKRLKIVSHV